MKNVLITLKSGSVITSRMTDENANFVYQAKYDEKDYFDGDNFYIQVPYDEELGQDGLVTTTLDIEAIKIIVGDGELNGTND